MARSGRKGKECYCLVFALSVKVFFGKVGRVQFSPLGAVLYLLSTAGLLYLDACHRTVNHTHTEIVTHKCTHTDTHFLYLAHTNTHTHTYAGIQEGWSFHIYRLPASEVSENAPGKLLGLREET